ncbi:MAG: hypothetical protein ACM3ZC_13315 [Bacteroidota bacterium]
MASNTITAADVARLETQLASLKRQDIAMLGDGQVFIRRLPNGGQIRAVKGAIVLREHNGEIAGIQGKWMTTSKGFNSLNQIAGLSIITPERLVLPSGETVVNPYPLQDPESGSIAKVWVRKLAIGYGPTGNLVVTSATLLYDIKIYFIQDVLKKVNKSKDAGRVCLESQLTDNEKASGLFLRIDGQMGIWANYCHSEILTAMETFVNKKLFAERNAQSIAERLVMAKHPALAHAAYVDVTGPDRNHATRVPVVGFVNDLTREQMMDITAQAERGDIEIQVGGQKAQVVEITGAASMEDIETEKDAEEETATNTTTEHSSHAETGNSSGPSGAAHKSLFDVGGERL